MNRKLSISHFEEISRSIYKDKWLTEYFHEDKELIIHILSKKDWTKTDFLLWEKKIWSLQWLSVNICSKINSLNKINDSILKTRHEIKADIALFIDYERIEFLVKILKNIKNLKEWSPSMLEAISRKHIREKDSLNNIELINKTTSEEEKEINALNTWLKANIRKYSEENNKWEIDWERIIQELNLKWHKDLAKKFKFKNKLENFIKD